VRLSQVARVTDGVQDTRTRGMFNGQPAIVVNITQQPDANLIETADAIDDLLPQLREQLPPDIELEVAIDRTGSVRASVREVEITLVIAVLLVVAVVGLFLRNLRAALIPAVATVVSLLGTFGVMFALGFSLNNLTDGAHRGHRLRGGRRHRGAGEHLAPPRDGPPAQACRAGGRQEVGFTVLTISVSLIAVFIRFCSWAAAGAVVSRVRGHALGRGDDFAGSLTTTPMLCAAAAQGRARIGMPATAPRRPGRPPACAHGRLAARGERRWCAPTHSLDWALASPWLVIGVLLVVIGLNGYLFSAITKGFFPDQDNGLLIGGLRADQSISSTAMADKLQQAVDIIRADPSVGTVVAFAGGRTSGGAFCRRRSSPPRIGRQARGPVPSSTACARSAGASPGCAVPQPGAGLRIGGRSSSAYQYTLKGDNAADLKTWTLKLAAQLRQDERVTDIDDDQSDNGVESFVQVDRSKAASLGVSLATIDAALYNAFGQRQVANVYTDLNQYTVVMEWAPRHARSPLALADVQVPAANRKAAASTGGSSANPALRSGSTGQPISVSPSAMVPLSAFATVSERAVPTAVYHDGGELSATLSFNLGDGVSIEQGRQAVLDAVGAIGMPNNVRGDFRARPPRRSKPSRSRAC
jgi:multidrug efflux pump